MGVRSDGENDARHLLPKGFSIHRVVYLIPCVCVCTSVCVCVQSLQLHCAYNCDAWLKRALTFDNKKQQPVHSQKKLQTCTERKCTKKPVFPSFPLYFFIDNRKKLKKKMLNRSKYMFFNPQTFSRRN